MILGGNILTNEVNEIMQNYNYSLENNDNGFKINLKGYTDYYIQFSCDEQIGWNVFIVPLTLDFDLIGEHEEIYAILEQVVDKINNQYYYYDKKTFSKIVDNITILKNFLHKNISKFNISSIIDKEFVLAIGLKDLQQNKSQLIEVGFSRNYNNWFLHHNNVDFLNNKNFELIKSLKEYINLFNKN